jgi:heme-degrading monooxygenase HmoA
MAMIFRHWRGVARVTEADNYVRHLQREIFPKLSRISGFVSASILRRQIPTGVEFVIVTTWRSMDAIRQFSGEAGDAAVVPPVVQAMMVDYDRTVAHYEVVDTHRAP